MNAITMDYGGILKIICKNYCLFFRILYLSTTLSMADLKEGYGAITPSLLATSRNTKE